MSIDTDEPAGRTKNKYYAESHSEIGEATN